MSDEPVLQKHVIPAASDVDFDGAMTASLNRRLTIARQMDNQRKHARDVPRTCDVETQRQAYDLYLNHGLEPDEIALELGISVSEMRTLVKDGAWSERREALRAQVRQEVEEKHLRALRASSEYQDWAHASRTALAKDHFEVSQQLVGLIRETSKRMKELSDAGKSIDTQELRRLAESLSSAATVGARAVGLTDKTAEEERDARDRRGKIPLVMVNIAPPRLPGPVVEVKEIAEGL